MMETKNPFDITCHTPLIDMIMESSTVEEGTEKKCNNKIIAKPVIETSFRG